MATAVMTPLAMKFQSLSLKKEFLGSSESYKKLSLKSVSTDVAKLPLVTPVAKRVCQLTGKKRNNGYKVSFSNHRTKKIQEPNLQKKRLWWDQEKRFVTLKVCTKALKTIERKGLDAMAKEAGINLHKF